MRIGAQWTESRERLPKEVQDQAWLGIGYLVADAGAALILIAVVVALFGLRKLKAGGGTELDGTGLARTAGIISVLLLAAYVVAIWAMSTKPE